MTAPTKNRLLQSLSGGELAELTALGRPVDLQRGYCLFEAEDHVETVWFPETGLLSIISVMRSGAMIETSLVGSEGGVGHIEAAGSGIMFSRVVVQIPGQFLSIPASDYRHALGASSALRRAVAEHSELLVTESRQSIACMAMHDVEERMAWWLLEAQERAPEAEELPLTQELLSVMLGATDDGEQRGRQVAKAEGH